MFRIKFLKYAQSGFIHIFIIFKKLFSIKNFVCLIPNEKCQLLIENRVHFIILIYFLFKIHTRHYRMPNWPKQTQYETITIKIKKINKYTEVI